MKTEHARAIILTILMEKLTVVLANRKIGQAKSGHIKFFTGTGKHEIVVEMVERKISHIVSINGSCVTTNLLRTGEHEQLYDILNALQEFGDYLPCDPLKAGNIHGTIAEVMKKLFPGVVYHLEIDERTVK